MNIMLQIAGFVVMIVIFIFYFVDRKAAVKSNKLFLYQGIAIFVSLFLDIFSIVLINTPNLTYTYFTELICRLYLISCVVVVWLGLYYVLADSISSKRVAFTYRIIAAILLLAGSILTIILPLKVVYDPNGLNDYTEGLPIVITYVDTFIFMGLIVGITTAKRKQMFKKRVLGVYIFISLWVFGSGIQALFNYVLTDLGIIILSVSFSESLGSLVIYIMLENPSLNIDKVTGALNQRALEDYFTDCFKKKENIQFCLIDYDNAVASSIMGTNAFSKAITDILWSYDSKKIFKNDHNNFISIKKHNVNINELEKTVEMLKDQFYRNNNIKSEIPFKIIFFNDLSMFYSARDTMDSIPYIVEKSKYDDKKVIEVTKDMVDEIHKKFVMDKKCDVAFSKRSIDVYYQPIYSNNDLAFTSAEALVRLRDEDGSLIYPGDFIEEMEKDGRIVELGRYVFESVCKFISENDMEKLGLHYIEVNLSAVQCMQEKLAETYINIMEKYKIDPKYINLEITETAESNKNTLLKNMTALKEYGVSFSLDDFGTGNSNLNYIVEMPIQIVKFDRIMVNSYFENRIESYVMNSSIDMIKGLGYKIVFEGVEEENQINQVKNMKVDFVQGYYYSKPVDENSFKEFIEKNKKEEK